MPNPGAFVTALAAHVPADWARKYFPRMPLAPSVIYGTERRAMSIEAENPLRPIPIDF
jgi:hypothetical protein